MKALPEESIPQLAHSFVDNAISNGHLDILEGTMSFDIEDLQNLKTLLVRNLPDCSGSGYDVVE